MENLKGTIFSVGGDARRSLKSVMKAMTHMQYLLVPYDPSMAMPLNTTTHRLGNESRIVQYFVDKNSRSIDHAIQIWYVFNYWESNFCGFMIIYAFIVELTNI